jgi:hypothetical protein
VAPRRYGDLSVGAGEATGPRVGPLGERPRGAAIRLSRHRPAARARPQPDGVAGGWLRSRPQPGCRLLACRDDHATAVAARANRPACDRGVASRTARMRAGRSGCQRQGQRDGYGITAPLRQLPCRGGAVATRRRREAQGGGGVVRRPASRDDSDRRAGTARSRRGRRHPRHGGRDRGVHRHAAVGRCAVARAQPGRAGLCARALRAGRTARVAAGRAGPTGRTRAAPPTLVPGPR